MEAINWVLAHWVQLGEAVLALLTAASIITGLTPTPKDDEALAWFRQLLRRIGFLRSSDEPGTLKLPLRSE